jgi:hypothetical protein
MRSLIKTFSLLLLVSVLFNSCTDVDDLIDPPSDFYYTGSLPIPFYTHGNSDVPNINWGNEVGFFNLNATYPGVGVDTQTGILSWNENLPLGESTVQVTATNSGGAAIATVLFLHQFSGQFNGGYNTNPNSTIVTTTNLNILFNVNGTMIVTDSGTTVNGTWNFVANKLFCHYTVAAVNYELEFDLTYSVTVTPLLEGFKRVNGSTTNIGFARLQYQ